MMLQNETQFEVKRGVTLEGADGEAIAMLGTSIATFGSHQATLWTNGEPLTVELPGIPVHGARWSEDGAALFVGTGVIDVARRIFTPASVLADIVTPPPPGHGGVAIHSTSWSADGKHVAALLKWSGPLPESRVTPQETVVVVELNGNSAPIEIPAKDASQVRIVEDRVVIAAPVIRIVNFAGELVAELPATPGAPLAISGGDSGGPLIAIDQDWSIRVVDPATWTTRARWANKFLDAVAVPNGLIAIDHNGTLHAGCIEQSAIREVGTFDTGMTGAQLAVSDNRLAVMSAGRVQVMEFQLTCE
jgi:hypothetical protein